MVSWGGGALGVPFYFWSSCLFFYFPVGTIELIQSYMLNICSFFYNLVIFFKKGGVILPFSRFHPDDTPRRWPPDRQQQPLMQSYAALFYFTYLIFS